MAELIMSLKQGKLPHEIKSYRTILPIISKVFEKILLQRLLPIIEEKGVYESPICIQKLALADRSCT